MAEFAAICEALMVISFGFSWPMNIIKSLKTKSTKGKSLAFMILILFGYVCGITSKFIMMANGQDVKIWVVAIYVLNFVMVLTDLILYFINYAREKKDSSVAK